MYTVKEINNQEVWNNFEKQAKPSTFLHDYNWGEFEKTFGREVFRFGVYKEKSIVSIVQSVIVKARRGKFLLCTHGPVFSLEILKNDEDFKEVMGIITGELLKISKKNKCDFLRISTSIIENDRRRSVFKGLGFRNAPIHTHSGHSSILDLTKSEEEILSGMKKNARYSIKKAERDGISIRMGDNVSDLEKFWFVYETTFNKKAFTPYSKNFIKNEFLAFSHKTSGGKGGSDYNGAKWFFAEHQGEILSAALIVTNPWSGFYHHGASVPKGSLTPSELLQWHVIKYCKSIGCERYNFWGVVDEGEKNHPWYGFSKFKRSFGGYDEKYIGAQDYPITYKYWLNFFVETIRKWKRGV